MDHRTERVIIETDRHRIVGALTLPKDGYRSRMSDYLNASERDFISLTDVEIAPLDDGGAPSRHEFIVVARHHIVLAMPA